MLFKLACAQFAPKKGSIDQNLDRIANFVRLAAKEGADHLLFPEACVSGYFLEGGVAECALDSTKLQDELHERVGRLDRRLDVSIGYYEKLHGELYNSVGTFALGLESPIHIHTYHKFFLATYGVFDDERFVTRGRDLGVFETPNAKFGVLICEDVWHSILPTLCAMKGAEVMLIASASPARGFADSTPGNLDRYRRMVRAVCEEHGVFAANSMLCGFEGGKGFVGGSVIADPYGKFMVEGPVQDEHLLVAEIDLGLVAAARQQTPLLSDLRSQWSDLVRIVNSLD